MKKIKYFAILLATTLLFNNCTEDFDEINTNPLAVNADDLTASDLPLVARGVFYGANYIGLRSSPKVIIGGGADGFQLLHSLFTDVYANYFATTHGNFGSDQFELVGKWINGAYSFNYYEVAPELKFVLDATAGDPNVTVENAILKVFKVFFYHRLTDIWGPIPYSNFGKEEEGPIAFDSQEDIYKDFFTTLDQAVAVFKANAGVEKYFGNKGDDMIYKGSVDNWLKYANSLRLRLALRLKYVDASLSKAQAEKAIAGGVIESHTDNAIVHSEGPAFVNPYNLITGWGEFRMSADMESILKGYEDPRVADYFAPADIVDAADDPAGITFNYEGMRNGQTKIAKQATPSFNKRASDMAAPYTERGAVGPNTVLMTAAEVYFLRAEGALEGWNMGGGTAQSYYESGITASLAEYGHGTLNLSGSNYVASTNVPADLNSFVPAVPATATEKEIPAIPITPAVSTVPVAYEVAGTKERQLEQIITQKWIALYPNSEEAYAERRRTGYPVLYDRLNSINADFKVNEIPRRLPFAASEYDLNAEGVAGGVQLLGGPDSGTTKLWWDKK